MHHESFTAPRLCPFPGGTGPPLTSTVGLGVTCVRPCMAGEFVLSLGALAAHEFVQHPGIIRKCGSHAWGHGRPPLGAQEMSQTIWLFRSWWGRASPVYPVVTQIHLVATFPLPSGGSFTSPSSGPLLVVALQLPRYIRWWLSQSISWQLAHTHPAAGGSPGYAATNTTPSCIGLPAFCLMRHMRHMSDVLPSMQATGRQQHATSEAVSAQAVSIPPTYQPSPRAPRARRNACRGLAPADGGRWSD